MSNCCSIALVDADRRRRCRQSGPRRSGGPSEPRRGAVTTVPPAPKSNPSPPLHKNGTADLIEQHASFRASLMCSSMLASCNNRTATFIFLYVPISPRCRFRRSGLSSGRWSRYRAHEASAPITTGVGAWKAIATAPLRVWTGCGSDSVADTLTSALEAAAVFAAPLRMS